MAAALIAAAYDASPRIIENAAESALEHRLGMTGDPVAGYVQVPSFSSTPAKQGENRSRIVAVKRLTRNSCRNNRRKQGKDLPTDPGVGSIPLLFFPCFTDPTVGQRGSVAPANGRVTRKALRERPRSTALKQFFASTGSSPFWPPLRLQERQ